MIKKMLVCLLAVLLAFAFVACATQQPAPSASQPAQPEESAAPQQTQTPAPPEETPAPTAESLKINVAALKGPTGIGMVQLMDKNEKNETSNSYNIVLAGSPDEITAGISSGEFAIAACPINLASVLYNKMEGGVQLLAINTKGVLYILEKGNSVQSVGDLKDKKLYATGQGATPEYILGDILSGNNLSDAVDIEYKAEHAELATLAAAGEIDLCMLPEPNVTAVLTQNPDMRIALDLTEEWQKLHDDVALAQGCIIVRKEFAEAHPQAVVDFMKEYEESVDYVNSNLEESAALVEGFGIMPSAAMAQKAIPNCNITFISGEDMKETAIANFNVLFEANPKSIGGALPGDDFYFSE
ncbi:MAG: ABC transporter substrate-binding protein [Christensenellales bacterium]|jgi:NitT/TauT family transport system substrate-binding protein